MKVQEEEGSGETWIPVQGSPGALQHCGLSFLFSVSKLDSAKAIPTTDAKFERAVILKNPHAIMLITTILSSWFPHARLGAKLFPAVSLTMQVKFAKDM